MRNYIGRLLLLLLVTAQVAKAQNYTRPNITGADGLQVNSYTGNLFAQRKDLSIPGRGLSINILFSYNSAFNNNDYGFGFGWNINYNQFYIDTSGGLLFQREDGRQDFFTPGTNGALVAPIGIFDKLTQPSAGVYLITKKDGTQYYFENTSNKKLTRIVDRNGNQITLSYSGNELTGISDASGRTVSLVWSGPHLQSISASFSSPSRTISYSYNDDSCLTSIKDAAGYTTKYGYAPGRLLNDLIDGNGNESQVTYSSNNAVLKLATCLEEKSILYNMTDGKTYVTDQTGGKTEQNVYTFDGSGRLVGRTGNCCGFNTSYSYDANNDITRIVDAAGNATVYGYDANGNLLSVTDATGRTIRYTYESVYNQIIAITDKIGNHTSYTYDAKGNLTAISYPLSITKNYTYDTKGELTGFTDGRGNPTTFGYDNYGDITTAKDAAGNTTTLAYDGWGNYLTSTDANGHTTTYTYDALSRPTNIVDALSHTTKYNYDAHSNVTGLIDANNNPITLVYDPNDKLILTEDAMNHMSSALYDGLGNLLSSADANGNTTTYTSDNENRVTAQTNAASETTSYTYDGKGDVISTRYPNGNVVNKQYDALGRVVQASDILGMLATYTYDANSNKLSQTDGQGNTVSFRYDALNRIISQSDPTGGVSMYQYDENNNLIKSTDRNGNSATYVYDVLNRLQTATNANGATTTYSYDNAGNRVSIADANGNRTSYSYDALNRTVSETFANNSTTTFTYDNIRHLVARTDNTGQLTKYVYDKAYRLLFRQFPASTDSFTYDNAGRMLSANSNQAKISLAYDAIGRMISETLNGKPTQYTYNTASGLKTILYPNGQTIQRKMDGRNELVAISENGSSKDLVDFAYNGAGQNTFRTFANGVVNTLNYTGKGDIAGYTDAPLHITDAAYSYDKNENPVSATYTNTPSLSGQYSYDKINELTGFSKGSQQQSFAYDNVNNRVSATINGQSVTYAVNNMNAYTSITAGGTTVAPQYDGNGNMINDGTKAFGYDAENRITSVGEGSIAQYVYDALGRRIEKITPADTINYYYSAYQVIEEHNGQDQVRATYIYGSKVDDIVVMQVNGGSYYYNKNITGSILSITDSMGGLVERYEYDAFGKFTIYGLNNTLLAASSIGNRYTFAGREYDTETGLYYYRARYYDPVTGRFLQRDPLGYVDGMGAYTYTKNMPLTMIDPYGTESVSWCDYPDAFFEKLKESLNNLGKNLEEKLKQINEGIDYGLSVIDNLGLEVFNGISGLGVYYYQAVNNINKLATAYDDYENNGLTEDDKWNIATILGPLAGIEVLAPIALIRDTFHQFYSQQELNNFQWQVQNYFPNLIKPYTSQLPF